MVCCVRIWPLILLGACAFGSAGAAATSNAPVARPSSPVQPILRAPAPIYSRDSAFVVFSSAANADYRLPVMQFADELRRALSQLLNVPLGTQESPVDLVIGDAPGETQVRGKKIQDVMGRWREQIEFGDPELVDLDDLRLALARALLRAWSRTAAEPGATPTEPPEWFLRGLVRAAQRTGRQHDYDTVFQLWSQGRLPPVMELLAAEPAVAMREPALAAVLATWLSERSSGGERMRRLLLHLAAGGAWSGEALPPVLWPDVNPGQIDENWDRWLGARGRAILEPGVTTAVMLRRFRLQLAVYPADFDAPLAQGWRARSLPDLLPYADAPWMKRLADAKSVQLRAAALGRDGTLHAVAEAYAGFFTALAQREPAGVLQTRLRAADRLLAAAENALVAGQSLQAPVPSKKLDARKQESE